MAAARRHARGRTGHRAVHVAGVVLLLLAVLPAVLPYDHVLVADAVHEGQLHERQHVEHCHVNPGSCADAPLASGPGLFLQTDPLVAAPAMLLSVLLPAILVLTGRTDVPEHRPPQAALLPQASR